MAFENADEIVLWIRRTHVIQPRTINDGAALPSIKITGPGNINWMAVIEAGTTAGTFKLRMQDRLNNTVETYDNLVVNPASVDFIEKRINGTSKLPIEVAYLGGGAGNPVNGTFIVTGTANYEARIEGFRTLPMASGQHEVLRYAADRVNLLAGLTPTQISYVSTVVNTLINQAQTKLGV